MGARRDLRFRDYLPSTHDLLGSLGAEHASFLYGDRSLLSVRAAKLRDVRWVAIAGIRGSGKTSASRAVERYGFHYISSSDVVRELLGVTETTPIAELQRLALALVRHPDGPQRIAEAIYARVQACGTDRVVIDGIRQPETYGALRKLMGSPGTIGYVHTSDESARRMLHGRRLHYSMLRDLHAQRSHEVERDAVRFASHPDVAFVIRNACSPLVGIGFAVDDVMQTAGFEPIGPPLPLGRYRQLLVVRDFTEMDEHDERALQLAAKIADDVTVLITNVTEESSLRRLRFVNERLDMFGKVGVSRVFYTNRERDLPDLVKAVDFDCCMIQDDRLAGAIRQCSESRVVSGLPPIDILLNEDPTVHEQPISNVPRHDYGRGPIVTHGFFFDS